jgi:predicted RNA binding protein YcfA (HicA-like mRNA interferase family)
MSPRRLFSSDEIITALERAGFVARKSRGGHGAWVREESDGGHRLVIVPLAKREIPLGTFRSILKQAGLSHGEFLKLAGSRNR